MVDLLSPCAWKEHKSIWEPNNELNHTWGIMTPILKNMDISLLDEEDGTIFLKTINFMEDIKLVKDMKN